MTYNVFGVTSNLAQLAKLYLLIRTVTVSYCMQWALWHMSALRQSLMSMNALVVIGIIACIYANLYVECCHLIFYHRHLLCNASMICAIVILSDHL